MKNTDWPVNEIERVAKTSGRPLEVACAQAFLARGWTARLGSHFADGLDGARELDVLAEREEPLPPPLAIPVRVRALVSCRGFPPERSPLMYSVSKSCVPSFSSRLLSSHRVYRSPQAAVNYGPLHHLEEPSALRLLQASGLDTARPLVAFDMVERTETVKKKSKNKPEVTVEYGRCRDGDRQIFSAIDSAVKAAFFWAQEDYQTRENIYFASLNAPVCVLSIPFWDVCIDGGVISHPNVSTAGYQSSRYPYRDSPREIVTLVWCADEISRLIDALDEVFTWFVDEIKKCGFEGLPTFAT